MQTFVLTTDGGPHTPDDWALVTATALVSILQVAPNGPNSAKLELLKMQVQADVATRMVKHHQHVQDLERELLAAPGGSARLQQPEHEMDPAELAEIDEAVADVRAALQPLLDAVSSIQAVSAVTGRPIEMPTEDAILAAVHGRVEADLTNVMFIERSWYADRNPSDPNSQAFAERRGAGPALVTN